MVTFLPAGNQISNAVKDPSLVLVVDDWKSPDHKTYAFTGRLFDVNHPDFVPLLALLKGAGAAQWHASESRKTHHFLFDSPSTASILAMLDAVDSRLFQTFFLADQIESVSQAFRSTSPTLRELWDRPGPERAEALALILFLWQARFYVRMLHPTRLVRMVVDRVHWLPTHAGEPFHRMGNCGDPNAVIYVLADKTHADVRQMLPLFGLVDSEMWFAGRYFHQLTFADGRNGLQRLLAAMRAGKGGLVSTASEVQSLLNPHRKHPQLLLYWRKWVEWFHRKVAVNVAMTPEEILEVYPADSRR